MQNENQENLNQSNEIKKNPSRDNKNINQGQNDEKRFDAENESNRDMEVNPSKQMDRKEIDLDRDGISTSQDEQTREFGGGRESDESDVSVQPNRSQSQDVNKNQDNSKLQ